MLFLAACQRFSNAEPVERLLTGTRFPAVVLAMDCLLSLDAGGQTKLLTVAR